MSQFGSLFAKYDDCKSVPYRDQACRVLNAYWSDKFGDSEVDREVIWSLTKKCEEVDAKKGAGNSLDQMQANRVIEALLNDSGDFLDFKMVRDAVSKDGFEAKRSLSLIDFAVYKFGLDPKQIILASQTDDFDGDALMEAAGERWTAADAAATSCAAAEAAAAAAVEKADRQLSDNEKTRASIASMETDLTAHLAALEISVADASGAVKVAKAKSDLEKAQKAGESAELRTLKSRIPGAEKKGAAAKAKADEEFAAAAKANGEAATALEHATNDSELNVYVVAGGGSGTVWFEDKEAKSTAANR